jgi:hypothetical protein
LASDLQVPVLSLLTSSAPAAFLAQQTAMVAGEDKQSSSGLEFKLHPVRVSSIGHVGHPAGSTVMLAIGLQLAPSAFGVFS